MEPDSASMVYEHTFPFSEKNIGKICYSDTSRKLVSRTANGILGPLV